MQMLTDDVKREALELPSSRSSTLESLCVLGISYQTADLELRSHLNFSGERGFTLLQSLSSAGVRQCLVLSTCNRTEIYFCGADAGPVLNVLSIESGVEKRTIRDHCYSYRGEQTVRHLFRVASGLESAALGETEILSQLKDALRSAAGGGHLCGALNLMFRRALETSKRVRTETALCKNVISVASMAVRQANVVSGGLRDKRILLLGAGAIAERLAKEISKTPGATCTVANRTVSRAEALASEYGFNSAGLNELSSLLETHDVVFCAISSEHPILTADMLENKSLTIVDLGVPSVVDSLSPKHGSQIVDMEFLASACAANSDLRSGAVEEAEAIIESTVKDFEYECSERDVAPAIEALVRLGDQVKQQNLNWAYSQLDGVSDDQRKVVEDMAKRIVRGMLQGQISAMKSQSLSSSERACLASVYREIGAGTVQD